MGEISEVPDVPVALEGSEVVLGREMPQAREDHSEGLRRDKQPELVELDPYRADRRQRNPAIRCRRSSFASCSRMLT